MVKTGSQPRIVATGILALKTLITEMGAAGMDELGAAVLVHGACLGGWCWFLVEERLARAGLRVQALDLPLAGMDADTGAVREAIDEAQRSGGPVTVVAHSMGGLSVSAAARKADRLVFVAAAMPLEREPPAAMLAQMVVPGAIGAAEFAPDGTFTFTKRMADYVCQDSPEDLRRQMVARLRPTGTPFPTEPIPSPAWLMVPSAYVVCRNDECCPPAWQRGRAALVAESTELDADHCPFFSAPDQLSAFIMAQAAAAARR